MINCAAAEDVSEERAELSRLLKRFMFIHDDLLLFFLSFSLFFPPPCNTRPSNKDVLLVQIVLGGVQRVKIGFLTALIALRSAIQVMAAGARADCVLTSPIVQDQDTFCYPPRGPLCCTVSSRHPPGNKQKVNGYNKQETGNGQ